MQAPTFLPTERIASRMLALREQQVMLDADLAELYGVETRVLVQAIKRNAVRFRQISCFSYRLRSLPT